MESIERIRENFSFFDDWEDKYRFVIDLGKPFLGFCLGCQLLGEIVGGKVVKSS